MGEAFFKAQAFFLVTTVIILLLLAPFSHYMLWDTFWNTMGIAVPLLIVTTSLTGLFMTPPRAIFTGERLEEFYGTSERARNNQHEIIELLASGEIAQALAKAGALDDLASREVLTLACKGFQRASVISPSTPFSPSRTMARTRELKAQVVSLESELAALKLENTALKHVRKEK